MKAKIAVIAAVVLVGLTGCAGDTTDANGEQTYLNTDVFYKDLPTGKTVLCISARDKISGGSSISCDWAHTTVGIGEEK